jgi:hypothetical protein
LEKVRDKARPFDELVIEGGAAYQLLEEQLVAVQDYCELLCDVTEIPGLDGRFFRLNQDKVLRWLLCKMDHLMPLISSGAIGRSAMGNRAVAASLVTEGEVQSTENAEEREKMQQISGIEILKDYVGEATGRLLYKHYGLDEKQVAKDYKKNLLGYANANNSFHNTNIGGKAEVKKDKPDNATSANKRLRKEDTSGMKSMTSFFAKKSKPAEKKKSPKKKSPKKK